MRCFELTDTRIIEGLRVQPGPDLPYINVTSDGELYCPIDPSLHSLIARASAARSNPIRMLNVTVMPDGESITSCTPGTEALVRLDVSASRGGKVTLSASNDRGEVIERGRVVKRFGPFPSVGTAVMCPLLNLPFDERPWTLGAPRLEMMIVMTPGASFRIFRSRTSGGIPMNSYILWTGMKLEMTKVQEQRPPRASALQATV